MSHIFEQLTPDDWEIFASWFLQDEGYTLLSQPSVGPDGGIDFSVENENVAYLVSCKNYIKSGKKVSLADENSILDRVQQHGLDGFIGFYSTGTSSDIKTHLDKLTIPYIIYDQSSIQQHINGLNPQILQAMFSSGAIIFNNVDEDDYTPLLCCCGCGQDILKDKYIHNAEAGVYFDKGEYWFTYGMIYHLHHAMKLFSFPGSNKFVLSSSVYEILKVEHLSQWLVQCYTLTKNHQRSSTYDYNSAKFSSLVLQKISPKGWL